MDSSWKKNIKYNISEFNNKKFLINNSPNKNNIFNIDNIKTKKDIYLKKKENYLADVKTNDNYQSYQIFYLNNPHNFNNSKGQKMNNKIMVNNYYTNTINLNKKAKELSANNNYKNNVKLMTGLNKKTAGINITNNKNYINSKNKERNIIHDTFSNINNNKGNIFKTSNTN